MCFDLPDFKSWFGFTTPLSRCCYYHLLAFSKPLVYYVSGYVHDGVYIVTGMTSFRPYQDLTDACLECATSLSEIVSFNVDTDDDDFCKFQIFFDAIRSNK